MGQITGKRRLIFGLFTVTVVGLIEYLVEPGWSKTGAISIVLVAAFFYGERMVTSLTDLVNSIRGKFSKSDD